MDGFDPAALLPDLSKVFGNLAAVCRFAVMIGPVVMLALGLAYLFLSPKEANYYFGYRCYYGMGSVNAWRFTQRLAGLVLSLLGGLLVVMMLWISSSFASMEVYRCYYGMGSVNAWRFTQRLAGLVLSLLGGLLVVMMLWISSSFASMEVTAMVYGMGSVNAWRFTQRLAGLVLSLLGGLLVVMMLWISSSFASMEVTAMVWKALDCLIWQAVAALLATLGINGAAAFFFDRKGELRRKPNRSSQTKKTQ